MSLRPFRDIHRKKTKVINVGDVKIGGDNPISVQSMTNTLTTDIQATIKQINNIHEVVLLVQTAGIDRIMFDLKVKPKLTSMVNT